MCGPQASAKPITTANTQRAQPTKGAKPTKKPSKSSFNKLLNALKNIFG